MVSLNPVMVDGTGMCGGCRVTVGGKMKFACVDGPEFDGHAVDFDEMLLRAKRFTREEQSSMERYQRQARLPDQSLTGSQVQMEATPRRRTQEDDQDHRQDQDPHARAGPAVERAKNFAEVALGYTEEQALAEAERCIMCKKPTCIAGCPVEIDIPEFIQADPRARLPAGLRGDQEDNILPAICGRVCPQETQCEQTCVVGHKLEPVAIGRLERFVGDMALQEGWGQVEQSQAQRPQVRHDRQRPGLASPAPWTWPAPAAT